MFFISMHLQGIVYIDQKRVLQQQCTLPKYPFPAVIESVMYTLYISIYISLYVIYIYISILYIIYIYIYII